jgi:AcrR family transcriptional regulator
MRELQYPWIKVGYETFAHEGPGGLKVERIAKAVGKNKSSFYHFFADLEVFTEVLLEHHLSQAKIMAEKESQSGHLEGLISVFIAHKTDLLFSRQLRVYRDIQAFEACFSESNRISLPSFLPIWAQIMGLKEHSYLSELVLYLSMDNFFLQITDETLETAWLTSYFRNLQNLVGHLKSARTLPSIDGSV